MGNTDHEPSTERDEPRFEPWLGVMCASFVPILLLMFLPKVFTPYLLTLTGIIFVMSVVLLVTQQRGIKPEKKAPAGDRGLSEGA